MQPGFRAVIHRVDDAGGDVAEDGGDVDDECTGGLRFEVREEADGEVHGAADVDIDFLIGFVEVEIGDVKRPLDAGVIDQAVYFWVVCRYCFDEGGDGGDVAGVEDVVGG